MGKDIKQKQFESDLLEPLLTKNYTRQELCILYKMRDSNMRQEVARISLQYPVISHSKKKGYRICDVDKVLKSQDQDKINEEIKEIKHTINELNSRIKQLKKRQKPLIKALKILTKGEKINE